MWFRDYAGKYTESPPDLKIIVALIDNGTIVWSSSRNSHQVRYGLQVKTFTESLDAATEFGKCVHHWAECNNLI